MSEGNFWGVYFPPVMAYVLASVVIFLAVNFLIRKIRLDQVIWHLALFEISLGVIIFSTLILFF
jgi:hypothetical protein